jgi:O-methyltransferase
MVLELLLLLLRSPSKDSMRFTRVVLKIKPNYTMISTKRLYNLYNLIKRINSLKLPGDIVECGVWNGGASALMAFADDVSRKKRKRREIWLFDSFEGLPPPGKKDGKLERDSYFEGWNKGRIKNVKRIFKKLEIPLKNVKIVKGWFDSTLDNKDLETIAILHIDADWYDSVKTVLEILYDKVVPGGYIVVDDYWTWSGCKKAVDEFMKRNGKRKISLKRVGRSSAIYFKKPK